MNVDWSLVTRCLGDGVLNFAYRQRSSGTVVSSWVERDPSRRETEVRRIMRLVLALCGALLVVSPANVADASPPTSVAGTVQLFSTPTNGVRNALTLTGVIGDYGTGLEMTGAGAPSVSGNFVKLTLHQGTFKINKTKLDQKLNRESPALNQATCSGQLKVAAPVTVFDGTGLYEGITGSIDVTVEFALVLPKFASGAHKGQCNFSNSSQPLAQWGSITGTGHVRYP